MRFEIEPRPGYLYAQLWERETAEEMREFLVAVSAACRTHGCPRVLVAVRRSRPAFKAEDYGLNGYALELASESCQIALVADTPELHAAHEYIEVVARGQSINVRAFREEAAALRWMQGPVGIARRYRFSRLVVAGAPDDYGVYALWDGEEVIYYGRGKIRTRLLDHLNGELVQATRPATHYGWEICTDPATREAELVDEHRRVFGRAPRLNEAA